MNRALIIVGVAMILAGIFFFYVPEGFPILRPLGTHPSRITLFADEYEIEVGGEVTFYGALTADGVGLGNRRISIDIDGARVMVTTMVWPLPGFFTWTTPSNFTKFQVEGIYECYAEWEGDDTYASCRSESISITVGDPTPPPKIATTITLSADKTEIVPGERVTFTGRLRDDDGNGLSGKQVSIDIDGARTMVNTTSGGNFTYTTPSNFTKFQTPGSYPCYSEFDGDDDYEGSTSPTVIITVSKIATTITLSADKTQIVPGERVTFSGKLRDDDGNGLSGKQVSIDIDGARTMVNTTSGGNFTYTTPSNFTKFQTPGTYPCFSEFAGDSQYDGSRSATITITVTIPPPIPTTITLSADKTQIMPGEQVTFSGRLRDEDGNGLSGKRISIDIDGVRVMVDTTSGGNFTYTTPSNFTKFQTPGSYPCFSEFAGDSQYEGCRSTTVMITVSKVATTTTLSADKTYIEVGEQVTFSGKLRDDDGNGLSGKRISIDIDGVRVMVDTTSGGNFTYTTPSNFTKFQTPGTYPCYSEFDGDSQYEGSSSPTVTITVETPSKTPTTITLSADKTYIEVGEQVTFSGVLSDEGGNGLSGKQVSIDIDGARTMVTTGWGGLFSYTTPSNFTKFQTPGTYPCYSEFDGDSQYEGSRSATITITVVIPSKILTTVTLSADKTYIEVGEQVTFSGNLRDEGGNGLSGKQVSIDIDGARTMVNTTSGGNFTYTTPSNFTKFQTPGTYPCYSEFDGDSQYEGSISATVTITVGSSPPPNEPPVANFTYYFVTEQVVAFEDQSWDIDGTVVSWFWVFGDGETSTSKNPVHAYDVGGNYPVSLTVTDDDGDTGTDTEVISVIVPNQPPEADFSYIVTDMVVSFIDLSWDSDGTVVSWLWNFGDGTTSTLRNPVHTYTSGGDYVVGLTVTDDDGATDTTTRVISIDEPPPPPGWFDITLDVNAVEVEEGVGYADLCVVTATGEDWTDHIDLSASITGGGGWFPIYFSPIRIYVGETSQVRGGFTVTPPGTYLATIEATSDGDIKTAPLLVTVVKTTPDSFTVNGIVTDEETGLPINGVIIQADGQPDKVTISNPNGTYSITLLAGSHTLSFTHDDYEPYTQTFSLTGDLVLNVELVPIEVPMPLNETAGIVLMLGGLMMCVSGGVVRGGERKEVFSK